jgi:outer membrane lipoprotein
MWRAIRNILLSALVALLLLTGCVTSELVPSDMVSRVSRDISFQSLQTDPDTFRGRWMVLGGKVLSAKRLKHETQIEILELPLDKSDRPIPTLTQSRGRFLAVQREFLDPAIVPPGTFVSLVGEVIDGEALPLDEISYTYPVVQIKTLKVWPDPGRFDYLEPGPYPYGPWPYPSWRGPFWGPYPYPYRYWWP